MLMICTLQQRRRQRRGRAPLDEKIVVQHDVHGGVCTIFAVASVDPVRTVSLDECSHGRIARQHLPYGLR